MCRERLLVGALLVVAVPSSPIERFDSGVDAGFEAEVEVEVEVDGAAAATALVKLRIAKCLHCTQAILENGSI